MASPLRTHEGGGRDRRGDRESRGARNRFRRCVAVCSCVAHVHTARRRATRWARHALLSISTGAGEPHSLRLVNGRLLKLVAGGSRGSSGVVEGRPPPLVLVVAPRARGVKVDPISVRMRGVESEPAVRLRRGVAPGNMGNLRVQGTAYVGGGVCRICGSRLGGGDAGGAKMPRACSGSAMIATMVRAAGGRQWVACAASAVRAECARPMRCQRQSEDGLT